MTLRYDDQTTVEEGGRIRIIKPGAELQVCKPFHGGHTWVKIPLPVGTVLRYAGQRTPAYSSWGRVPFFSWHDESENVHHYGRLPETSIHWQAPPVTDASFYEVVE